MRGETDQGMLCNPGPARSCPVSSTSLKVVKYWFALMDGGNLTPPIIQANQHQSVQSGYGGLEGRGGGGVGGQEG